MTITAAHHFCRKRPVVALSGLFEGVLCDVLMYEGVLCGDSKLPFMLPVEIGGALSELYEGVLCDVALSGL